MNAIYFLVLVFLVPRTGEVKQFEIDSASFTQPACWNLQEYFKEHPVRQFDAGRDAWVLIGSECTRQYDD